MMPIPRLYRKKPVEVVAVHLMPDNTDVVALWCGGEVVSESETEDGYKTVDVPTADGPVRAIQGDYVIRGVHGEYYTQSPNVFLEEYERVDSGEGKIPG